MHKVILKGREAVCVKCSSCRISIEIQANRLNHPVTVAFVHARQSIAAKCKACEKDFAWSPEDLVPKTLQFEAAVLA